MRGRVGKQTDLLCLVNIEERIPKTHPLRAVKRLVDQVLADLSPLFEAIYAAEGRPSIPPERLLKAKLLQALFTVRSEVALVEAVEYNLLFRWFLDLNFTDPTWDNSTFTKNQQRLLEHEVAQRFFDRVVGLATEHGWVSDAHFTVDGSLIEAWASLKSLAPKGGPRPPNDGDPGNPSVDFRGQKRANDTHQSTTDPQARLARKGRGKEARLCYGLHALMENRNGLCVGAKLAVVTELTESAAAAELVAQRRDVVGPGAMSVGADKAYHTATFVGRCRSQGVAPHVAIQSGRRVQGVDRRTTRTPGYRTSQRLRKRIEEIFGWCKQTGGLRRLHHQGVERGGLQSFLVLTAYNLIRMARLLSGAPPPQDLAATA